MKFLINIAGIDFEFSNKIELLQLIEQKIVEISSYKEHNSLTLLQLAYLKNVLKEIKNYNNEPQIINSLNEQIFENLTMQH